MVDHMHERGHLSGYLKWRHAEIHVKGITILPKMHLFSLPEISIFYGSTQRMFAGLPISHCASYVTQALCMYSTARSLYTPHTFLWLNFEF